MMGSQTMSTNNNIENKYFKAASLPEIVLAVVKNKGTEYPFTGEYNDVDEKGTYLCRLCGLALFRAEHKFHSGCGWPSFDNELPNAVSRLTDKDGKRTEILCARCDAHLGHVFLGEGFTKHNLRHCVNSLSLDFVVDEQVTDSAEAIFACGCFWGVEYYFKRLPGVLKTEVGYSGGHLKQPTYEEICQGTTGHVEAIRVLYDLNRLSYQQLCQFFFEIHDFSQKNGQGPDLGQQYLSVAFYYDESQKQVAENVIKELQAMHYFVATTLMPVRPFWSAERYHQDYYQKKGKQPYCHHYTPIFSKSAVK
ncbi:MAG TPA: bifunctional methionine sulfoxide reductase B/A protein [Candidatus Berkiella sp.]|nr:bifunctional methionine sulfoxide reductase B/A protein [Candidatus Berkiella sp.]